MSSNSIFPKLGSWVWIFDPKKVARCAGDATTPQEAAWPPDSVEKALESTIPWYLL